jgi:hypothetical protein
VRTAEQGEKCGSYANWVAATGSASTVDVGTIKELLATPGAVPPPVVIQDNDDAGDGMVAKLRQATAVELVVPPTRGHDIEDHVRAFGDDHRAAFASLQALLRGRRLLTRPFDAVAQDIYRTRQKQGEDDLRRDFEIHDQVKALVLKDMAERGTFYREHQQGYYFHAERKQLIGLDDGDKELSCFLDDYGLNATETCFKYVAEALHVEALTSGTPTHVRRLCWFNPETCSLYVFNHAAGVYKVTAESIGLVDNGTDGVLFLRDRRNEPWALAEEVAEDAGDLFHEAVTAGINFAEDGRLEVSELQALFDLWFLSTFFGSILPTRPLLGFIGPKGSGKSHTLRKIGVLLFGPEFDVKNLPDKEDAFDAVTTNSHFAAFDNADSKVAWLPDRLAICATGGTVSKRKLFTTNQLVDYPIDCFVGITSRTPHFRRDDVADRLLVFHVKRFEESEFVAEQELLAAVLKDRGRILTAVLRRLQHAIRALRATTGRQYKTSFRMADFATFALRISEADGGREALESIFERMGEVQASFSLEADNLVDLLSLWLEEAGNHGRQVNADELHKELGKVAEKEKTLFIYKSARSLAQRLANVESNLRAMFHVESDRDAHSKSKRYAFRPR